MTSPIEIVRQKLMSVLSDPVKGLNPVFAAECQARKVAVPYPGFAGTQAEPFNFAVQSPNVFQTSADVDWLDQNSIMQYPCLIVSGAHATQAYERERILGLKFWGDVSIEMRCYLAWSTDPAPDLTECEFALDALESAFLQVINCNPTSWIPILYANRLNIQERIKVTILNNRELLRTGLRLSLTARYGTPEL